MTAAGGKIRTPSRIDTRAPVSCVGADRGVAVDDEFRALLGRLRGGDATAADDLCRRFGPFVRAAVRRRLPDDLRARYDSLDFVQDVWASVLARPADRLAFDSPAALVAFLTRVAENKVIDAHRRRFATEKDAIARELPNGNPGADADRVAASAATPSQWAIAGERWDRLIAKFPPGHRPILERLRDGHTAEDIARLSGVSLSTVNRVVRRLREVGGV
jgi:RNA polymerase sigma-70 factor (ECF subfamily)